MIYIAEGKIQIKVSKSVVSTNYVQKTKKESSSRSIWDQSHVNIAEITQHISGQTGLGILMGPTQSD